VGVEIVEILHGGVGGDVEQGARTSKQILVFAYWSIVSLTLSLIFVQSIIFISYHICLCCAYFILPCIYSYCYSFLYAWLDCVYFILLGLLVCVCLTYTHPTRASHSTSTHFKGNQGELVQSLARGIRLHLLYCISLCIICISFRI